jgi:hypothetical protein
MRHDQRLQVEVYSHGGWWKDSLGRTGQVPSTQASKGPMATVAAVANGFGTGGWQLTDLVSAHHNTYLLTFEPVAAADGVDHNQEPGPGRAVTTSLG